MIVEAREMDDLISRQDAIDVVHKAIFDFFDICDDDDDEESPLTYMDKKLLEVNKSISTQIKDLPSAQPEIEERTVESVQNVSNDDLISRKVAIDAIEGITSSMSICVNSDECHGMKRMQRQAVIELANLPSAQPDIVRCKECAKREICRTSNVWVAAPSDDWFCADAERRTDE